MAERILVAGIGNVFLGDDGFGVEVVSRLREEEAPPGVEIADYGIRGYDLAYALMDGYDLAILVDALPRGGAPGTLFLLEPDLDALTGPSAMESHAMNPMQVFRLVKQMGASPPPTLIVGCEPESLGEEGEGEMGLSEPVAAAVGPAVRMVRSLLRQRLEPRTAEAPGAERGRPGSVPDDLASA